MKAHNTAFERDQVLAHLVPQFSRYANHQIVNSTNKKDGIYCDN